MITPVSEMGQIKALSESEICPSHLNCLESSLGDESPAGISECVLGGKGHLNFPLLQLPYPHPMHKGKGCSEKIRDVSENLSSHHIPSHHFSLGESIWG